jgi:arylsulfatase A-like enzyme
MNPRRTALAQNIREFDDARSARVGRKLRCYVVQIVFCLALTFAFLDGNQNLGAERPNIILILTDDMGYGDLGCYGGKLAPTPNIDRLAAEGIRFTQFYVASPVCSPSRVGLLTGMYPARWHITNFLQTRAGNRASEQLDFLDPKAPSIARTLKNAGYATGHFGKWHMGGGRDVTNAPAFREYGFDEHAGTYESPEPDPNITSTNWIWSAQDKVKRWQRSAYFVDKTIDFLQRHKSQPCYVDLWPDDVHTPWVPEANSPGAGTDAGQGERNFHAVLREYDRQTGRLLDRLQALDLARNTLVIFTSDNGPLPTFAGARSGEFRGSKISLYEGGVRVPFIARWPGHFPSNSVDNSTVLHALDLVPTLCAIAKVPISVVNLDGEDLSQAFFGKPMRRGRSLFWEYGRNSSFNYPKGRDRSPNVSVRDGQWKLLVNADGSGPELYDLISDPGERHNLADKNPAISRVLTEAALRWRKSLPADRTFEN